MSDQSSPIEVLFEDFEAFGKTTLELAKLKAVAKYADMASNLVMRLVIIAVICLFILIISVAFALWIGDLLGKSYYGFFCIGFFYAFVILMLWIFKTKWLKTPVSNLIIIQLLQ